MEDGLALLDATGRALAALLQEIDRLPADTLREHSLLESAPLPTTTDDSP